MKLLRKSRAVAAGVVLSSAVLLAPTGVGAATWGNFVDNDPAHHSTDVSDMDPAHHRPFYVCSASTTDCTWVPVAGFDVNGNATSSQPGTPAGTVDNDPAHHSTDASDTDPAHHRPFFVCDTPSDCRWVPVAGFDLNGMPVSSGQGAPVTADEPSTPAADNSTDNSTTDNSTTGDTVSDTDPGVTDSEQFFS